MAGRGRRRQSAESDRNGPGSHSGDDLLYPGQSVSGGRGRRFTLTANQISGLEVFGISSYAGGNAGNVTIEIDGANFTPNTTASLTFNSTLAASSVDFVNAGQIFATFDLNGACPALTP